MPVNPQDLLNRACAALAQGILPEDVLNSLDDPLPPHLANDDVPWNEDEPSAIRVKAEEAAERVRSRSEMRTLLDGTVIPLPPPIGSPNVAAKTGELEDKVKVLIMPDTKLEYPQLYLEVYVQCDGFEESSFAEWLVRTGCTRAQSPKDADLVIFGGGVDVEPALYGATPHPQSAWMDERDNADITTYLECYNNGIPMLGICRGAQFLHVMNGGKLVQHIENDAHYGDHPMLDLTTREVLERVSSSHHQMVVQNIEGGMQILATTNKSRKRWLDNATFEEGPNADIEAFFYRETMCLGIQGHPEYRGYHQFAAWAAKQIDELIICNPDITWEEGRRRIKPEVVAMRDSGADLLIEHITPTVSANERTVH